MRGIITIDKQNWAGYADTVKDWLAQCERMRLVPRLWQKDPTLWSKDPAAHKDIKNRLGWLSVPRTMKMHLGELRAFQEEVRGSGYTHALLLGMGGSSLAPEVLQAVLGNAAGFPQLLVLDSTDPARVLEVEKKLDLSKTLFIVSSKSGNTIELHSFFQYFFERVQSVKADHPGQAFIAITDPGTPLAALAKEQRFQKIFLAPEDVGGRFSALTVFGLVPACIIGADVKRLLDSADRMMMQCSMEAALEDHAALPLGVGMAVLAEEGRDKLTLVTSDAFSSFGDWAEQLVAESTGKEGFGIVPVVREALEAPEFYGSDRFFVSLSADSEAKERAAEWEAVEKAGHPVLGLRMKEPYDLGGEFFRWEMATAIACALLKINAFDQPDVQAAKERSKKILGSLSAGGEIEIRKSEMSLDTFWENAEPGDYAAILAFLPDREPLRKRLSALREAIRHRTRLAATLGFGPRYLHSTGQLHKGGPKNGVFVMITAPAEQDVPVPGEKYSFGQLELAQAMGDFEALENKARWVMHLRLPELSEAALDEACSQLEGALQAAVS